MRSSHPVSIRAIVALSVGLASHLYAQSLTPQDAVDELLAADRAFSAASARTDLVSGLTAMFAEDVVMPAGGKFARGIEAAKAALRAGEENAGARAEWTPVRGGISADGRHGFTFGYMTITHPDGTRVPAKYLSYGIRTAEGWRVAAYKRSRAEKPPATMEMMAPALPSRLATGTTDEQAIAAHRRSLDAAERAFSDEAQQIGIGRAFVKYGSADAINLGSPTEPTVIVGSEAIGRFIGSAYPPGTPGVSWAPESVIVASSGDLGVTIGLITPNGPRPDGKPASPIPFFTIWRRPTPADPWRYIAE